MQENEDSPVRVPGGVMSSKSDSSPSFQTEATSSEVDAPVTQAPSAEWSNADLPSLKRFIQSRLTAKQEATLHLEEREEPKRPSRRQGLFNVEASRNNEDPVLPASANAGELALKGAAPLLSPFRLDENPYLKSSWQEAQRQGLGQQLNRLDTEMSSGLEQYLPTPIIRLQVIKQRLEKELADLKQQCDRYQALDYLTASQTQHYEQLKAKRLARQQQENKIGRQFHVLLAQSSPLIRSMLTLQQWGETYLPQSGWSQGLGAQLKPEVWVRRGNPDQQKVVQHNQQLQELTEALDEALNAASGANTTEVIADLMAQIDRHLASSQPLSARLQTKSGWWTRLNQSVGSAYLKWFRSGAAAALPVSSGFDLEQTKSSGVEASP